MFPDPTVDGQPEPGVITAQQQADIDARQGVIDPSSSQAGTEATAADPDGGQPDALDDPEVAGKESSGDSADQSPEGPADIDPGDLAADPESAPAQPGPDENQGPGRA